MSHCKNCDARVETDWNRYTEWNDSLEHHYGSEVFRGRYDVKQVGETPADKDGWVVGIRIDLCGNCGEFVDGRTFAQKEDGDTHE